MRVNFREISLSVMSFCRRRGLFPDRRTDEVSLQMTISDWILVED